MQTFVDADAQSICDAVSDIQPLKIVTSDVCEAAVKLPCIGDVRQRSWNVVLFSSSMRRLADGCSSDERA